MKNTVDLSGVGQLELQTKDMQREHTFRGYTCAIVQLRQKGKGLLKEAKGQGNWNTDRCIWHHDGLHFTLQSMKKARETDK